MKMRIKFIILVSSIVTGEILFFSVVLYSLHLFVTVNFNVPMLLTLSFITIFIFSFLLLFLVNPSFEQADKIAMIIHQIRSHKTPPTIKFKEPELRLVAEQLYTLHSELVAYRKDVDEKNEQLEKIAYYDSLTNLLNRTALIRDLKDLEKEKKTAVLLLIDIHRFRLFNNLMGQKEADSFITTISERIKSVLTENERLYRIGSDEFSIISLRRMSDEQALSLFEEIQRVVSIPFRVHGKFFHPKISGAISVRNTGEESYADLISEAEIAMLYSRYYEGSKCLIYRDYYKQHVYYRFDLETELRKALQKSDELFVVFQPIVHTKSDKVACETLIRWNHPQLGTISPSDFIPVAEESGLIGELTAFVMKEAFRIVHQQNFIDYITINLSPILLQQEEWLETQLNYLHQRYPVPAAKIGFELTEGSIISEKSQRVIKHLSDKGYKLLIDDFGTGYSSFGYLVQLPVHSIKIDRSFIQLIQDSNNRREIVKAIVQLSKSLNIEVVAEGVELIEQKKFLEAIGCQWIQGYFESKPLDESSLVKYVRSKFQRVC